MQAKKLKKFYRWPKKIKAPFSRSAVKYKRKKKRDLSGKFVILLNSQSKKIGALLKFVSRKTCEVVTGIAINKCDLRQTSKKFIISPKKNMRLLREIEVIVNLKFQQRYEKIVQNIAKEEEKRKNKLFKVKKSVELKEKILDVPARVQASPAVTPIKPKLIQEPKRITPIKIFSCGSCNHKFTNRQMFEEHVKNHEENSSSESESELVIDDDVMFVLENYEPEVQHLPRKPQQELKHDPNEPTPEKFFCLMGACQQAHQQFETEEALVVHIGLHHEKDEEKKFTCRKCPLVFARESGLIAHQRISHKVTIIPINGTVQPEAEPRRKSMFLSDPSKLNGTPNQNLKATSPPKQIFATLGASTSTNEKITFERFSSANKKSFICRICSISFQQRQLLDRHMSVHHISRLYFCYKCKVPYTLLVLLSHLKTEHADSATEPEYKRSISECETVAMYRCAFCQYSSRVRPRVDAHLRDEHYEEFEKSEERDAQASSPDSLDELLLPATAKLIAEQELKKIELEKRTRRPFNDPSFKFRCARCHRRFVKPCTLKKHFCERKEHREPKVKLVEVLKDTPKPPNLMVMHGFHKCPRCPQVFSDLPMFKQHVETSHKMQQTPNTGFYGGVIN